MILLPVVGSHRVEIIHKLGKKASVPVKSFTSAIVNLNIITKSRKETV